MSVEKVGQSRDVWVMCPHCHGVFYVDRSFYTPKFDRIALYCPRCHKEFAKEDSPQTWGR